MTLPTLQILDRRNLKTDGEIVFCWIAQPKTEVKSYNIYSSHHVDGPYLLFKDDILNKPISQSPNKGQILFRVLDSQIPIAHGEDHYFKLTSVDIHDVESLLSDSPERIVHPPQIDQLDEGQYTDRYVYNFCWDEVSHRWLKGRKLAGSQYVPLTIGTIQQIVTFDNDTPYLEIQNDSDTAVLTINLNCEDIAVFGGMPIYPKQYYTASRLIVGSKGITAISSELNTPAIFVSHF